MRIRTVLMLSLTLMVIANLSLAQTPPTVKGGQNPGADQSAAQRRNSQTTTEQGRLQSQVDILTAKVGELETRLSALESRPAATSRPSVQLTPDSAFPKPPGGKADDFTAVKSAVDNLWQAVDLIRVDLKKLSGR